MIRSYRALQIVSLTLVLSPFAACGQSKPEPRAGDGESNGRQLYYLHCVTCHEFDNPDLLKKPPELGGLFKCGTLPSGAPATDAQVRKTIIEGRGTMPAFDRRLSDQDVRYLIEYLHTLKREDDQAPSGR